MLCAGVLDELVPNAGGAECAGDFAALLRWNDVIVLADEQEDAARVYPG